MLKILLEIIIPILGFIFVIIQTFYLVKGQNGKKSTVNENKEEKNRVPERGALSISNITRLIRKPFLGPFDGEKR